MCTFSSTFRDRILTRSRLQKPEKLERCTTSASSSDMERTESVRTSASKRCSNFDEKDCSKPECRRTRSSRTTCTRRTTVSSRSCRRWVSLRCNPTKERKSLKLSDFTRLSSIDASLVSLPPSQHIPKSPLMLCDRRYRFSNLWSDFQLSRPRRLRVPRARISVARHSPLRRSPRDGRVPLASRRRAAHQRSDRNRHAPERRA